jgi:nucleotide-binding universal stress UspA family protein
MRHVGRADDFVAGKIMRVLIYVGPAPSRDLVLQFSAQIVHHVATAVTLVTGGGEERRPLLDQALERLQPPAHVTISQRVLPGDAQVAVLAVAREQPYDMVMVGRLHQSFGRRLPGAHSKSIAQRLEPSVLRVHGPARSIKRILLSSGGDYHTFDDVSITTRIAAPLGAAVAVLHVLSQQSLFFEGFPPRRISIKDFLSGNSPEANTLRDAAALLSDRGVPTQIKGRVGPVLDEILDEVRDGDYDMLVIGAHRVTSVLDRILLEDITGDLLDRSPLPVLVVRGHGGG